MKRKHRELVKAVMDTFPNATIDRVRKKKGDEKE